MVLYTVIPIESVLGEDDTEFAEDVMITVGGVNALVRPEGNGYGVINRVLSSNPADFLKADLTPGTRLWLGMGK